MLLFDLTHNPVAIALEYANIALTGNLSKANAYAGQIAVDEIQVTFGFAKEAANIAYSVYNIVSPERMAEVALCKFEAAERVFRAAESKRRMRRGTFDADAARQANSGCEFNSLNVAAPFNITSRFPRHGIA